MMTAPRRAVPRKEGDYARMTTARRSGFPTECGRCPSCGSESVAPILYGLPGLESFEAARRGELIIGGCMPGPDACGCLECGRRWEPSSSAPSGAS